MPLVILTGLPSSGKSTRARQLYEYLSRRISTDGKYRLHLISDQTLSIPRDVYDLSPDKLPAHTRSANASEKDARATMYGAVKRVLSDRDIVLLDGLNYIKGWRYQLFCEAKAVRTPSAVLQVGSTPEKAKAVNEERLQRRQESIRLGTGDVDDLSESPGPSRRGNAGDGTAGADIKDAEAEGPYEPSNWENLVFRYEEPNGMNRWDSPLFTLIWEDDEQTTKGVFDKLWDVIAGEGRQVVRPNQATVQRGKDANGDYLYMLDRETQEIVRNLLDHQGEEGGGEARISRGTGEEGNDLLVELPAGNKVGLPQLQRLRRAFIGLNRGGIGLEGAGNLGVGRIREGFVGYLNDAFNNYE